MTLGDAVSESELRPVSGDPLVGTASLSFREGLWRLCLLQLLSTRHARSGPEIGQSLVGTEARDLDLSFFLLKRFQVRPDCANSEIHAFPDCHKNPVRHAVLNAKFNMVGILTFRDMFSQSMALPSFTTPPYSSQKRPLVLSRCSGNVASRCPDQNSCRPLGRDQTLVPYPLRTGTHQVDATCGAESECRSHGGT